MKLANLSLKQRLLLMVLGTVSLIWLATAVFTYIDSRRELNEVLDAHLAQISTLVAAQIANDFDEAIGSADEYQKVNKTWDLEGDDDEEGEEESDDDDDNDEHFSYAHPYSRLVAFQVWKGGTELVLHSSNAPQTPLGHITTGFSTHKIDDRRWRVFSTWNSARTVLIHVAERADVRDELAEEIIEHQLTPLWISLPLLGLILWWAIATGLAPLKNLAAAISRRDPQNLAPLEIKASSEVTPLINRLNHLFDRIRALIDNERRFTADAAHELRTPIASIKAQVQVAQNSPDDQARQSALEKAVAGCNQATHLIEQLLSMARLESVGSNELQDCELSRLASEVVAEMAPEAVSKQVQLELNSTSPQRIQAQPELLRVMLRNLIDNAIRHTPSGTTVVVTVAPYQGKPSLSVCDDGKGLDSNEIEKICRRFYRPLSTQASGSGLGLSIVQRIADIYQAKLALSRGRNKRGLCARVYFI